MEAYCVKCKKKVNINNETVVINKKGLRMAKGNCPICDTKVCRIIGK